MKKFFRFFFVLILVLCLGCQLTACSFDTPNEPIVGNESNIGNSNTDSDGSDTPPAPPAPNPPSDGGNGNTDENTNEDVENRSRRIVSEFINADGEPEEAVMDLTADAVNGYALNGDTLTITAGNEITLTGEFYGNIVVDLAEENDFEINLAGVTVISYNNCPIYIKNAGDVDISANKDTQNFIYDNRSAVEELSDAIYCTSDLKLKGTGALTAISRNNEGIHSRDDLTVQKLTLYVQCKGNALKGNDGVEIRSGDLTLIATQGDGIKTSNSTISAKGNQKGCVTLLDGTVNIYAACDGIDAAYDINIEEAVLNIYTDRYSEYSEEVTQFNESVYYIRFNSTAYSYSLYFYNDEGEGVWRNSSSYTTSNTGWNRYYYYEIPVPSDYSYLRLYMYAANQPQGQSESYYRTSNQLTYNANYDTLAVSVRNNALSVSWTNYTTTSAPGWGWAEGNPDKGDYSTKGLKADNEININSGIIYIRSYDDAVHANSDVTLENGETAKGNVNIFGGALTLSSNDDGIHADGILTISGGTVNVTSCYEGLEGQYIVVNAGDISVISTDDGINAAAATVTDENRYGIELNGGNVYVRARGDGIDSNVTVNSAGIFFNGSNCVVIQTSNMNSCIDTERGYTYASGSVVGISPQNAMWNEVTQARTPDESPVLYTINRSIGSVSASSYLQITASSQTVYVISMPPDMTTAGAIYLGTDSASFSIASSTVYELNGNGVYFAE